MRDVHLFCFGLGYSAAWLACDVLQAGGRVSGTVTRPDKRATLQQQNINAFFFGDDLPLDDVTHILLSVPPDAAGDPVLRRYGEQIARLKNLQWVGYLSATSVYGDHDGRWIDEDTPATPAPGRGAERVLAENQWRGTGLPMHIFRLSGIYGPGRSAIETAQQGRAQRIIKPGHAFNRIHVADIAQVLRASMAGADKKGPHLYNLADDLPAPSSDVTAYACQLLNLPLPTEIDFDRAELSPMARSFYAENKKIRNDRIKRALGIELLYPDYKAGLASILKEKENQPVA